MIFFRSHPKRRCPTAFAGALGLFPFTFFLFTFYPAPAQDTVPVAQPAPPPSLPSFTPDSTTPPVAPAPAPTPAVGGIVVTTPAAARFETAMNFFDSGQFTDAVPALSNFVRDF